MPKRIKAITLSCVTVLCCLALIMAAIYVAFGDSVDVVNHLVAGELKVQLYRERVFRSVYDSRGEFSQTHDTVRKNFTNESQNIFGLTDNDVIVPGCSLSATFTIQNVGDVEIGYYLEFVFADGDIDLANQLELTVSNSTPRTTLRETFKLSQLQDKMWGSASSPKGVVAIGGMDAFTVRLEFVDLDDAENNKAQNQQVKVDMIVHAIQIART